MLEGVPEVSRAFLPRDVLQRLLDALTGGDFLCIGPRLKEGVIVYEPLADTATLPQGVHDRQAPGEYRTEQVSSPRQFAWANGPQALKPFLFAPREALWRVVRDAEGRLTFREVQPDIKPIAVIGARACDLAALALQDSHFLAGAYPDPTYAARRENLFIVAVHCSHPAATCFCVSTGDGPRATHGFDIALSELDDGFVAEAGGVRGKVLLDALGCSTAAAEQIAQAEDEIAHAARSQSRRLPGRNLRDALFANLEHPRWEEVAERCLSCGNCTSVCPTCFCSSTSASASEQPSLDASHAEHSREWDSCFTRGHSYIHGAVVRSDTRTRYRQWLTHKLGSWHEQYGRSGCVGCGRCVTWCPTGIDITEETTAICGEAML